MLAALLTAAAPQDAAPARPQETLKLTVRDAVERALQNNLELEVARYVPMIRQEAIDSAWGSFDWVLHSTDSFRNSITPTASALAGAPSLHQQLLTTGLGVRQTTPWGPSYDLNFSGSRSRTNSAFATLNPTWNQSFGLDVTIPALRGWGEDAVYSSIVVARKTKALSVREFEATLVDVVFRVEKAYWTLVFAQEDLKVKRQSLDVAKTLLKNNQERFNAGLLAKIEVTRAEAEVAQREERIITAENAVADAADALKQLIDPKTARATDRDIVLVTEDAPQSTDTPIDEAAALDQALAQAQTARPEMAQLAIRREIQSVKVENAEDGALPKLDVVASARLQGLDNHFDTARERTFTTDHPDASIGINFEFPMARWAAEGDYMQAELERRRLSLDSVRTFDSVLLEIKRAVRGIKAAEKRQDATKKSVTLAKEQYDAEETRRQNGDATMFEVLKALEDLTTAQSDELRARIDYTNAKLDLDRAAGAMLQRRGILLDEQLDLKQAPIP